MMHAKRITALVLFLAGSVALAGCAGDSMEMQKGEPLAGEDLTQLIAGNTIKGKGYAIYYEPDGTMRAKEGSESDGGTWTVDGEAFCVRWSKWASGKELCWKLRQEGNTIYGQAIKNTKDRVVTWHAGNVESL